MDFHDAAAAEMKAIFRTAQAEMVSLFENYIALDIPGFELGRQRVILKQVDEILQSMDEPLLDWVEKWLPSSYERGTLYATDSLKKIGMAAPEEGFKAGFAVIDPTQVEILAESLVRDLDGAQAQILSKFDTAIRASQLDTAADLAVSRELATGIVRGEGIQGIKGRLLEKVLKGEIAPGGYKGSLEQYAEMLARTRTAEVQSLAAARTCEQLGVDLVTMIGDGNPCPLCAPYDGVTFSISGQDPDYPPLSTVGLPPWHPNCVHRPRPFVPELASADEIGRARERSAEIRRAA